MGKAERAVFAGVLALAALAAAVFLLKPREALTSTPSAYTGITVPLALPAGSEACADETVFETDTRIARFGANLSAGSTVTPALEVSARGYTDRNAGPYRNDYRTSTRIPGGWTSPQTFNVQLEPPAKDVFGQLCIKNLGTQSIDLVGSEDGRAYSRPTVRVDGHETPTELQFRLLQSGDHSLLSRSGQITSHASTLSPLGAWWFWLLALSLVTITPYALYTALRTSFASDAASGLDRDVARVSVPYPARVLPALARVPGWAYVAAACALAVAVYVYWSVNTHVFQNDEDQYVYLSRWLQSAWPESLWNFDVMGRGIQRLEVWLLAIPSALLDSPWSLRGGRILNTLAFVSTAIPAYVLARRLRLSSHWAALPAVLTIAAPWAVVTTAFLTENVAYPVFLWAVWAIWRTAARPSVRHDLTALVMLVVAGLARSGLLLLVPVLPLVVAVVGVRFASGGALTRVRRVLRDHVVLWTAVALGVLVLVGGGIGLPVVEGIGRRLSGGYATPVGIDWGRFFSYTGEYLSKVVVGTGFLPAAVALPWLAVTLARSRDRDTFAFAAAAAITALALFYSLNGAGADERYVIYFAPLILLPATLALARREIPAIGMGVTSVLLGLLLWRVSWIPANPGPFSFFVEPVATFYTRVVGLRLDRVVPGGFPSALAFAALLLAALGVAIAWALRRRALSPVPATVIVALVALSIPMQTQYTLTKYVNGAGSKAAASDTERAFADQLVPKGEKIATFVEGAGKLPAAFGLWQEVQFYNQRIDKVVSLGPNTNPVPPGDTLEEVRFDPRTGRLDRAVPDYVVFNTAIMTGRLQGRVLAAPSYLSAALMEVKQPATMAWSAKGFNADGTVDSAATVHFFTGRCARFTFLAGAEPTRWRLRSGDQIRTGDVAPGKTGEGEIQLSGGDVIVDGEGVRVVDVNAVC